MNEQELTRLIELYSGLVCHVAYCYVKNRADADDVMQEVFLSLFTYEKSFKDDEHIKAWLVRVTINRCKNLLSSRRIRTTVPLEEAEGISCEAKESMDVLAVIMRLKPKYRVALYMYYYEGYSVSEIAKALGEQQSAITTRLSRGRKQLKELLIKEGYDGF